VNKRLKIKIFKIRKNFSLNFGFKKFSDFFQKFKKFFFLIFKIFSEKIFLIYETRKNPKKIFLKKLQPSFGDLDILKWLNLAKNPLDGDLAEIIGECLDDYQCTIAAVNGFFFENFSQKYS